MLSLIQICLYFATFSSFSCSLSHLLNKQRQVNDVYLQAETCSHVPGVVMHFQPVRNDMTMNPTLTNTAPVVNRPDSFRLIICDSL